MSNTPQRPTGTRRLRLWLNSGLRNVRGSPKEKTAKKVKFVRLRNTRNVRHRGRPLRKANRIRTQRILRITKTPRDKILGVFLFHSSALLFQIEKLTQSQSIEKDGFGYCNDWWSRCVSIRTFALNQRKQLFLAKFRFTIGKVIDQEKPTIVI